MTQPTPRDILAFWFPDGDAPAPEEHIRLWNWRMRGGAHDAVVAQFCDLTARAAAGDLDHWAETPQGRLALILILDQFTRSVWLARRAPFPATSRPGTCASRGWQTGILTRWTTFGRKRPSRSLWNTANARDTLPILTLRSLLPSV